MAAEILARGRALGPLSQCVRTVICDTAATPIAKPIMGYPEHDTWGRRFCAGIAIAAAVIAVLCLGWPPLASQVLPWTLPPLHARCVGVMHLALALQLMAALRPLDPHALRIPVGAVAAWGAASVAGALLQPGPSGLGGTAMVWLVGWLAVAVAAMALLLRPTGINAPAERPSRAWQGVALAAAFTALVLLVWPGLAVAVWPWKLTPVLAAAYAGPFLAFGVAAWAVARERRRYVQRPAQQSLAALGVGVLAACLLHRALFDFQRPAAWIWFATFIAVAALALHTLRPAIRHT
jgi:hypothetical protein